MAERRLQNVLIKVLSVAVLPAAVLGLSSCSDISEILMSELGNDRRERSDDDKQVGLDESASTTVYETFFPTGTYTAPSVEYMDIDIDFIEDVYVYSVWYDAVDDNPADYDSIESQNAFALKGVFYFSTPLTTVFEARLCKNEEVILTKNITLKDNVTAECDFSAGLEGWGVFETGEYEIKLYFDDEYVGSTGILEVY